MSRYLKISCVTAAIIFCAVVLCREVSAKVDYKVVSVGIYDKATNKEVLPVNDQINLSTARSYTIIAAVSNNSDEAAPWSATLHVAITGEIANQWFDDNLRDMPRPDTKNYSHDIPVERPGTGMIKVSLKIDEKTIWSKDININAVVPLADFQILDDMTGFYLIGDEKPREVAPVNKKGSIRIYVRNNGEVDANSIDVQLKMVGLPVRGQQIDFLAANQTTYVIFEDIVFDQAGPAPIIATVDPENKFPESDEKNNELRKIINVR